MKVNYNWLKDFVEINMSAESLADLLTMAGLEVDSLEQIGGCLEHVTAARVSRVRPHPKADRLMLCDADTGTETVQVVCGAPNLKDGIIVPFAAPGVMLPGGIQVLETDIRGEKSAGMLLAEDEMGLTGDHEGLMVLPEDVVPGTPLGSVLPFPDWTFEISVTPNRPDWTSVIGIAREISALTGSSLRPPSNDDGALPEGPAADSLARVLIDDPHGCPRYCAGLVRGIKIGPSPFWLRYRLHSCGIRSINNVVDATNYVLLETGQPLHAFDFRHLSGATIVVRKASEGERFTTLDEESRTLNSEILLICDDARPVAIAGIMGGLNSEISVDTTEILLESAFFDPVTVRRGSRHLGLSTEASYRFERGVDPEGTPGALRRCLSMIVSLAGGEAAAGIIDRRQKSFESPAIELRVERTNRILGTGMDAATVRSHLEGLRMKVEESGSGFLVTPPSFRVDVDREIDLVEEVARIESYDRIPITYPAISPGGASGRAESTLRDRAREVSAGMGFSEVISYSFTSPDTADLLGAPEGHRVRSFVPLLNPLSIDHSVMRTSLIPGIAQAARTNISHGEPDVKLFEWGKIFTRSDGPLPEEAPVLAGLMAGRHHRKEWFRDERPVDFFDIKGAVETLLESVGVKNAVYSPASGIPGFDSEPVAQISAGDDLLGAVGRASAGIAEFCGSRKGEVYLFELQVEPLVKWWNETPVFKPYPRFPAVYRDLSIIVGHGVHCSTVEDIIRRNGEGLVEDVALFDVYDPARKAEKGRALAFRICYRSPDSTLEGAKVNSLHDSIVAAVRAETGGRLREG